MQICSFHIVIHSNWFPLHLSLSISLFFFSLSQYISISWSSNQKQAIHAMCIALQWQFDCFQFILNPKEKQSMLDFVLIFHVIQQIHICMRKTLIRLRKWIICEIVRLLLLSKQTMRNETIGTIRSLQFYRATFGIVGIFRKRRNKPILLLLK